MYSDKQTDQEKQAETKEDTMYIEPINLRAQAYKSPVAQIYLPKRSRDMYNKSVNLVGNN